MKFEITDKFCDENRYKTNYIKGDVMWEIIKTLLVLFVVIAVFTLGTNNLINILKQDGVKGVFTRVYEGQK